MGFTEGGKGLRIPLDLGDGGPNREESGAGKEGEKGGEVRVIEGL